MAHLKGAIFGVENVLIKPGELAPHTATLNETGKLVRFLQKKGVESIVMTNREWTVAQSGGTASPLQTVIEAAWGVNLRWFQCSRGGVPAKQSAESIRYVRNQMGWTANETVFVGNTPVDMQASVNGLILLLTAEWYEPGTGYGFPCDSPKEAARFIDTFCFRDHFWYFKIEDDPLRVYSLAPLSNFFDEMKYYSDDFIANVKNELRHDEDFWAKFLSTSLYFSGLYEHVNYITSYPKHQAGKYRQVLIQPMTTFAKCFRKNYIPDLVWRHTTALKSQFHRSTVTHLTQINSIHLNPAPQRKPGTPYAKFPVGHGKTVLLIDDVCTKGMSFEAARAYLMASGAKVICISFLKALKHDYQSLGNLRFPNGAFRQNTFSAVPLGKTYRLSHHVVDPAATGELDKRLKRYQSWDWPT
jgi:hypothetical protein